VKSQKIAYFHIAFLFNLPIYSLSGRGAFCCASCSGSSSIVGAATNIACFWAFFLHQFLPIRIIAKVFILRTFAHSIWPDAISACFKREGGNLTDGIPGKMPRKEIARK
jgi:hypothetical protein